MLFKKKNFRKRFLITEKNTETNISLGKLGNIAFIFLSFFLVLILVSKFVGMEFNSSLKQLCIQIAKDIF